MNVHPQSQSQSQLMGRRKTLPQLQKFRVPRVSLDFQTLGSRVMNMSKDLKKFQRMFSPLQRVQGMLFPLQKVLPEYLGVF